MSITQKSAAPLILHAKALTIRCFPEYSEMIGKLSVHLISKTRAVEKRNDIAAAIGALEENVITKTHMETLIGDSEDAVVVYYQTIDNESEFVHYLIHEFGHAISIRSNFDVYAEVQRDELYGVDSKRRAGSSIWSELIAEYIALQVDDRPFQEFSWVETDRLQCYLDEAVGGMQFDRYAFAFYLANYFGNGTIKEYLKIHPGAAIGLDKYDNELLEIIARVIDTIREQLNKDRYWIVEHDMLDKLGDSFEELWDYCEQKNVSRLLKQMRK